jgi:hypothetical protein
MPPRAAAGTVPNKASHLDGRDWHGTCGEFTVNANALFMTVMASKLPFLARG